MLTREELLKLFELAGAIRHGHFELSSGLHSDTYIQCALVLQYPRFAEKLGQALASLFSDARIDAVVSPSLGGLIIGRKWRERCRRMEMRWAAGCQRCLWSAAAAARCVCGGDSRCGRTR